MQAPEENTYVKLPGIIEHPDGTVTCTRTATDAHGLYGNERVFGTREGCLFDLRN